MPTVAQGFATSLLMGFESTPGVLPGAPNADQIATVNLQLSPNVAQFTSKAQTGVSRARPWVAGKIGADGTFGIECSRETLRAPLKSLFDQTVSYGVAGWYDHYYYMGNTLPPSYFLEQRHGDITKYLLYLGNQMSIWRMQCAAEGLMDATFTPVGLSMTPYTVEQVTGGVITDRTGSNPFNYLTATLNEGGSPLAYGSTLNWTVDRKMKRINAMDGKSQGYAIIQGDLPLIQVDLTAFYPDNTLISKAINGTETSLEYLVPAVESGHGMRVTFPTGKYLPTGITSSGQGELTQNLKGMFYSRGSASNVSAESLSKYFTTVTISTGVNDVLKVKIDGGGAQTFTMAAGSKTPTQWQTLITATITGATCVVENGRIRILSSTSGSTSSVQIDATGTAQTVLGFDTVIHPGFDAVDVLVRLSDAVATV